jgi:hypothetical protein
MKNQINDGFYFDKMCRCLGHHPFDRGETPRPNELWNTRGWFQTIQPKKKRSIREERSTCAPIQGAYREARSRETRPVQSRGSQNTPCCAESKLRDVRLINQSRTGEARGKSKKNKEGRSTIAASSHVPPHGCCYDLRGRRGPKKGICLFPPVHDFLPATMTKGMVPCHAASPLNAAAARSPSSGRVRPPAW